MVWARILNPLRCINRELGTEPELLYAGAMTTLPLTRAHHRRLREIYRSAGWPSLDMLEVELLAAGLLERRQGTPEADTLRVTESGIRLLAEVFARNKAARSPHEALVEQVAHAMARAGRLAWRGLTLRAQVPKAVLGRDEVAPPENRTGWLDMPDDGRATIASTGLGWCMACPDVFSIRYSSVEAYLEPVVHEIKVGRADLLGDLKKPAKRAAYLGIASACWYVLGENAKGHPIAEADEIPPECGVMVVRGGQLIMAREAPRRAMPQLPFHVWMALAKAGPALREDESGQGRL